MRSLSALHVVASINRNTGGPAVSVTGLAAALARSGVRTILASLDYAEHGSPIPVSGVSSISVIPNALGKVLRGWSPALAAAINRVAAERVDIIHHHGLWMVPGIYARRSANRLGLPLVISPRGMLDRWSLERAALPKALASMAYESRNLRAARLFHATSDMEAEGIRRYGLKQPIAVIANGVYLPGEQTMPSRELLEARFPRLRKRRWLLYMGRLDSKKGLDMLLDAWRSLHGELPAWQLIIAGPDLGGLRAALEASVADDPVLAASVCFAGMLDGELKRSALAGAELFVLPTRSENFGIAVAEALACGVPVVTTTAAPWADLVPNQCGWWVAPESPAITEALRSAMRQTSGDLRAMGQRGRQYAAERFSWDSIGTRMADVYRWIVSKGPVPACVRES